MELCQGHWQGPVLSCCTCAGSVPVVKLLLEHGADANGPCDAGSPVMWAAGSGKTAALQALLQAGGDPNAAANSNVTPALAASAAGMWSHTAVHGAGVCECVQNFQL